MNSHVATVLFVIIVLFILSGNTIAQPGIYSIDSNEVTYQTEHPSPVMMSDVTMMANRHFKKTKSGYKQYKRIEEYTLNRLGRNGQIVNASAMNYRAYNDYIHSPAMTSQRAFAHNGSWDYLGPDSSVPLTDPGIMGQGRANRFAFHPTDPNIIFVATAGGGLWKTLDKGLHWEPLTDGIPVMSTTGVAVDFTDPDVLYLLSGDGDGAASSAFTYNEFTRSSIGVLKSNDGGILWQPTGLKFNENTAVATYNLYMHPQDHLTLYACTSLGLFRTMDGGDHWTIIKSNIIYELEFKPTDPDRIYIVNNSFVFVSDDGGSSWIDSTLIPNVAGNNGRMTITTCVTNPDLVYLLASPIDTLMASDTIPDHRGFWLSLDSGSNFVLITTRPNILQSSDPLEFDSQASYDLAMECHPLIASQVMVGTVGIWQSTDFGTTWTHDGGINSAYHADIHALQINPLDNTLYLGCDGGVYMSTDFGETFEFRSGTLGTTQFYKIATSPFFTDYILAGAQDNGVHLRNEIETEFDRVIYDDGMESIFHPLNPALALTSSQFGKVLISIDTGLTFNEILPDVDTGTLTAWTIPFTVDAWDDDVIYVGYKPIYKSTDQGATFFETSHDTISGHRILISNSSYPGRLFAGDCRDCDNANLVFEMYRTENSGATWERIDGNPGFPETSLVSAAIQNPDYSPEVWITCGRFDAANKVFKSTDAGDTWTNMTGSLPNVPINTIAYEDNNDSPSGAVYIGTDIGVFYRNDNLGDWIYFSNQLPRVEVTDLDIDYNGGLLRASTYGRGLWESELYTSCQPTISLNPLNQPVGLSFTHHASQQIFSTALVDGYGSRVVYKSEGEIYLTEGFRATAKRKATFQGLLHPCGAGGIEIPVAGNPDPANKR